MAETEPRHVIGFWKWLVTKDIAGDRGAQNILNRWLVLHLALGGVGAAALSAPAFELARFIALPGAALLVGLSFGWAGRSAGLLQDKDFSAFIIKHGPPPEGYVYSFQLAILCVMVFVGASAVIAGGGLPITLGSGPIDEAMNRFMMFFFGSVAVRECWGVIDFVNKLTIQFYLIRAAALSTDGSK